MNLDVVYIKIHSVGLTGDGIPDVFLSHVDVEDIGIKQCRTIGMVTSDRRNHDLI